MAILTVNNQPIEIKLEADTPLLWALRDAANLTGTKYGCGTGECGACMVIVDGQAMPSCTLSLGEAEGRTVTTIEVHYHLQIGVRIPKTINSRHSGDDNNILTLEQRFCCRQPHLLNVIIDGSIFFDIKIGRWHIRLGLVVIIVGDKIFHRIVGKKLLELTIQLGGKRFVRRHDKRWTLHRLDDVGNGESLPRTGNTEQGLGVKPIGQSLYQPGNRMWLIAGRFELGIQGK